MARLIQHGEFVGPGERETAAYLSALLPETWVVVCNKELVRPQSVREVDFIVIGTHCIFAIEEKHWRGPIHGNENGWVLSNGESYVSPLRQADEVSRRLAGYLRDSIPGVRNLKGKVVFGRVVLSHRDVRLFVDDPRAHTSVVNLEGCEEDLVRFDTQQESVLSIGGFRESVIDRLIELPGRPDVPSRIGPYEVLEQLPSTDPVRCYRAQHDDGTERLLKVIQQPTTLESDKFAQEKRVLLREYAALKRLEPTHRAPTVDPYFSFDQDQFWVLPVHPIEGRSLRADRTDALPREDKIWPVLQDAFTGLSAVHELGIIHRGLTLDRVVLKPDLTTTFVDFVVARIEGLESVADSADSVDPDNEYRAPECAVDVSRAEPESDVWSLAATLRAWITGIDHQSGRPDDDDVENSRPDLGDQLKAVIAWIDQHCLADEPEERVPAHAVASFVATYRPSRVNKSQVSQETGDHLKPDSIVENQYRIVRQLGEGATAVTYLAEDQMAESLFVLKVIKNPELVSRLAAAEFRVLKDLNHRNLVRVFDVRPPGSAFHLKLEYVPGSSLRELMNRTVGDVSMCLRVGSEILAALSYLEGTSPIRIHRDVSPGNILVPDEEAGAVRLIDFGLATSQDSASSAVGTPRYRAPEIETGGRWTASCDLYSLGVVLFQMLTGRLPYQVKDGTPHKEIVTTITAEEVTRFGQRLLSVLLKSVNPDPTRRFVAAADFEAALQATAGTEPADAADGLEVINPFVNELRAGYRNSRIGNVENRGLDSQFAVATYVPTELDTELLPKLMAGDFRLVVLSGNPGDGKTAFLQQFGTHLASRGAHLAVQSEAGWEYELDGWTYKALYDASKSHESHGADELLENILEPLAGSDPPIGRYTAAIAANDGRLLDFFERRGMLLYPWLWSRIRAQVLEGEEPADGIVIVDLKHRALVSDEPDRASLFSGILDAFTDQSRWTACDSCVARLDCPMRLNALTFVDKNLSTGVRSALTDMLLAVHWQHDRRPTVRDLRSALAYMITHDLGCEDIHHERAQGISPTANGTRMYFFGAFDRSGGPDLLLDDLADLDPSLVPSPRLDRFFYFHRRADQEGTLASAFADSSERPRIPTAADGDLIRWLTSLKRRYYFEGRDREDAGAGDSLPDRRQLFGYRHYSSFWTALRSHADDEELLRRILYGISRADGVPAAACRDGLSLRMNRGDSDDVQVIKFLQRSAFMLLRLGGGGPFSGMVRDQLLVAHQTGSPSLSITIDLFEVICRAADGLLPTGEEQRPLVEDLSSFRNQLLAVPSQDVIIIEGGHRLHSVKVVKGSIVREEAT